MLYEVDGNQPSHSVGLTAAQLGEELVSLGCVRAICLDGGGSSAMALRRPGESTASLITSPSDGSQRACANYIFFINHVTSDNVTAYAFLTPSYRYVLPGASTWFSVKGADASYGPAPDPSGMSYTVSGDLGTVENQTFTAGTATGTATITASNGSVEGSMDICITGDVNSIGLQSAGKDISSISVKPGQSVDVDGIAYHLGQKMASIDTAFSWSVSSGIGSIDEKGVFTAGDSMASGTLTCSYGATSKSITVNVGMGDPQDAETVADFEAGTDGCTATEGMTLTRVTGYTAVARGEGSLKAAYDGTKVAAATISLPQADVSGRKHLTLWARGEGTQGTLTAVFADAEGNELTTALSAATTASWKQLTAAVPEGASKLTGIRFERSGSGAAGSALYLDQVVVSADHAVTNTDAPSVKLNSTALTVDAGAAATISGTATMENGKYPARSSNITVKVDGKAVDGAAKMSGATLTVTTGALSAGTHCVTIDVSDDAGNRTRASATVTAGSASNAFADTASHWARGYASLLNTNGIMKGETGSDGKTYFRPERDSDAQGICGHDGAPARSGHLVYRRARLCRRCLHTGLGARRGLRCFAGGHHERRDTERQAVFLSGRGYDARRGHDRDRTLPAARLCGGKSFLIRMRPPSPPGRSIRSEPALPPASSAVIATIRCNLWARLPAARSPKFSRCSKNE